jgi:translocation and assembly module TamA
MNSLGPRSAAGNVIGGDRFYQGSAELRYEVVDRVQLLTFLDLGSVWLDSIKKQRIDFGTGVGVRYSSPIGSLGADVGVPINPRDGSQAPEFYLRLGAAF